MNFFRTFTFALAAVCMTAVVGCDDDEDVFVESDEDIHEGEDEGESEGEGEETVPSTGALETPVPYFDESETTYSTLTLKWEAVEGAVSYVVKWWKDGNLTNTNEESVLGTSCTLSDLDTQTTYYAQVKACSGDGEEYDSSYSSIVSAVTEFSEDALPIKVSLVNASASTLTIEWTVRENLALPDSQDFNVELYTNAACTDLWVSWVVDHSLLTCGGEYHSRFTFTGLDSDTSYWVMVNVCDDSSISSNSYEFATTTFDYTVSGNATAMTRDVLLAEDFSGLLHGGDIGFKAVGVSGSVRDSWQVSKGENPTGYVAPVSCDTEWNLFTEASDSYLQSTGLSDWCMGTGTNVSTRAGYVSVGGESAFGYLATPVFSTIPSGATATVRVMFSAMTLSEGSNDYGGSILVGVVENAEVSGHQAAGWTVSSDSAEFVASELVDVSDASGLNMEFKDYSVTLSGVSNVSRIRFSSNTGEAVNNKTRFLLDNVVVTVSSISYEGETVYFDDDFEWVRRYAEAAGQVDCVGNHVQTGYVQTASRMDNAQVDGVSARDELHERGYVVEKQDGVLSTSGSNVYTFAMPGYFYFGNSTNTDGLHLPVIQDIPNDASLIMTFDWCPGMNTGSGLAVDNVALQVMFTTGSDVKVFTCPDHEFGDGYFDWIAVSIELEGVTITEDTDVFIRPQDSYWANPDRARWYVDSIRIFSHE